MEKKVKSILLKLLEIEEKNFSQDISIQNCVTWDSVTQLNIILALEKEFKVTFNDVEMLELTSFANIINALKKK